MATVAQDIQFGASGLPECSAKAYADAVDDRKSNQFLPVKQHPTPFPSDDADFGAVQTKVFKRRRRANAALAGDPERALAPTCCDRCKSDLNGKLMVRCGTCPFRCHLYCFSPPLKQHPGFLLRQQHELSQDDTNNSSPVWKCEKCQGTSVVFNVSPKPLTKSLNKKAIRSPNKRVKVTRNSSIGTSALQEKPPIQDTISSWTLTVQPQWVENEQVAFDWYRFRAEKSEVLRQNEGSGTRNGLDELVFYSKSYALMKKTAAIWRAHTLKRRRFRHRQEREARGLQYPQFRSSVLHVSMPAGESTPKIIRTAESDVKEDGDDIYLDHFANKPYARRPPRLPLLWEGEPPSAFLCWGTSERQEIEEMMREIQEGVCLASEDIDAASVENNIYADIEQAIENNSDDDLSDTELKDDNNDRLDIHLASKIIQRIFTRHHRRRRRIDRANRQRRVLEEANRRAKARSSIFVLRACIQFIIQLMKLLGQAQTKKAMLLVLRDSTEETQVNNNMLSGENSESETTEQTNRERKRQLAEIHICRFFMRRVHPYVKLKKRVMVRRIQRWWKHKILPHKWREITTTVRCVHRDQASVRIQRSYRRFRIQRHFRDLIEKHALNKLRQQLGRWIYSRLAKKEAKRCAEQDLVLPVSATEDLLPQSVPLDELLEARGMTLYQDGDFWNAASMLERLWELKNGNLAQELQQVLAYSHHMAWYTSYDQFNLLRAHELYRISLEISTTGKRAARTNPSVLQDFAIVLMQMEHFGDSLRLFAKLIEFFAREPQFPLWLLLAAVQLQQHGEWEQSVRYLSYLQDIPPPPYLERDILVLCAMGYERLSLKTSAEKSSNSIFAKEAWRSALRLWNHEEVTAGEAGSGSSTQGNGRAFSSRQKWDLLTNLAKRALDQGHYLLSCTIYIYILEREGATPTEKSSSSYAQISKEDFQTAWWNLADAFRHLGHIDLYLNAVQRSRSSTKQDGEEIDDGFLKNCRKQADLQANSFQKELKALTVDEKLQQLSENTTMH